MTIILPSSHRLATVLAVLSALAVAPIDGQPPSAVVAAPTDRASVVRLALPGSVRLQRRIADSVAITARATVRGHTIGVSNATRRAPYRAQLERRIDTLVVRPAPREAFRAVGLTWERERVEHVVVVPRHVTVLVDGAARLRLDATTAPRCASRRWSLPPEAAVFRCLDDRTP
ncbi:MAG: hypothetical protein MUE41_08375 [Gemmatimonadaceae bacterium]|jgi:hypothetical protein|nr:hypothetical protein [Gemmatimonadaceae bacterium]